MRRIPILATLALIAIVSIADAGPFGLFGRRQGPSCQGGQCSPAPSAALSAPFTAPSTKAKCICPDCPLEMQCDDCQCQVAVGAKGKPEPIEAEPPVTFRMDLDGKSFAGALSKQLKSKRLTPSEKRIARIIGAPDSAKRDRQIARMERHVRADLDLPATGVIDWSGAVNWPTMLQQILQLLIKLLPLFL